MLARLRSLVSSARPSSSASPAAPYTPLPITAAASTSSLLHPAAPVVPTLHFMALGAAMLLPWNLMISSLPFFASLLAPSSPLHASLPSTLSFLSTGTNFLALAWITFSAGKCKTDASGETLVAATRTSLVVLFGAFAAVELGVILAPAEGTAGWLTTVLLAIWVVGMTLAGSYLQSSVVAYSALFGPTAMRAVMSGQGAIAVLLSTVQLLSALIARSGGATHGEGQGGLRWPTVGFILFGALFQLYSLYALKQIANHPSHGLALDSAHASSIDEVRHHPSSSKSSVFSLFRHNAPINATIALILALVLAVFPAVTAAVAPSSRSAWWQKPDIWVPFGFFTFNVGDFTGRTLTALVVITSPWTLLTAALARIAFVPFFLGCNLPSAGGHPWSDGTFLLGLLLLGLSTGYLTSSSMVLASTPELNPRIDPSERELAGQMAVFSLVGGLVLGSAASFGVVAFM